MLEYNDYINSELEYEDGFLIDKYGSVIMSIYEEPVMKVAAEIITRKQGDILNVGFGLGIIDHYIQLKKPKSHTIIEPHKQLYLEAIKNGWDINVNMINKCWTDAVDEFIKEGKKFDGIYYDISDYKNSNANRIHFLKKLKYILKEDGVFSYFMNYKPTSELSNIRDIVGEDIYTLNSIQLNIEFDDRKLKKRNGYHIEKEHYIPVVRFKK